MSKNKIALITGGSRGLGRDMAINLAKKGIDIMFTYHSNLSAANDVIAEIEGLNQKAKAFKLDTSNIQQFEDFFRAVSSYLKSEFGTERFDFLINNAGTGIYKPFSKTTEKDFDEMVNIHFKGVYFLTQKAVSLLNDGGRIINISSGLARFSLPGSSAYASAKGAVEVFTRYMAKELSTRKITANTVAPGAIGTDFGDGENKTERKIKAVTNFTALGRVGEAEDIGGVVVFLCSPEAGWINGQRIEVSGGIFL
jgi:NAD(P)-dependent dehydrogenase (short-subunit alcohol dehydrogenase family)